MDGVRGMRILGGGCAGKLSFICASSRRRSASGSVWRVSTSSRPSVVGKWAWFKSSLFWVTQAQEILPPVQAGFRFEGVMPREAGRPPLGQARCG